MRRVDGVILVSFRERETENLGENLSTLQHGIKQVRVITKNYLNEYLNPVLLRNTIVRIFDSWAIFKTGKKFTSDKPTEVKLLLLYSYNCKVFLMQFYWNSDHPCL